MSAEFLLEIVYGLDAARDENGEAEGSIKYENFSSIVISALICCSVVIAIPSREVLSEESYDLNDIWCRSEGIATAENVFKNA